jgi:hypothetical protein
MRRTLIGTVAAFVALAAAAIAAPSDAVVASAQAPTVTIAAVGDIACKDPPKNNRSVCQYDDVAAAITRGDYDAFLALGDDQYEYGRYRDFLDNYDVYFGKLLPRTYPVPGNHEYGTENAAGYFRYYGGRGHSPDGWYSFDLGSWHVIALNSAVCSPYYGAPCGPGTPQYEWLKRDLATHPNADYPCTLAYWHHPRWDWEHYQNNAWVDSFDYDRAQPFWDLLVGAGADLALSGHNHSYSRWLPMDEHGDYDPNGVTQFIVGTGGRNLNAFGNQNTKPLTFVTGQSKAFGFLQLKLREGSYDWKWISAPGQPTFVDAGTAGCR